MSTATIDSKPRYRLLKNYYSRADYFRHDINKGSIRTPTGERICALTSDFLLGFHKAVEFECGKSTGQIFKSTGRRWGQHFVERFEKDLTAYFRTAVKDMSTAMVYECLAEAFRHHGWGRLRLSFQEVEFGIIVAEVKNSVMPAVLHERKQPSDQLMAGFLASFFGHFSGQDLTCEQTDCPCLGASHSRFVIGLEKRLRSVPDWVEQGLNHSEIVSRLRVSVL